MGTLIVGLVVALFIGLAIRSLWKSHKEGNGGCSSCPSSSSCPSASSGCKSKIEKL